MIESGGSVPTEAPEARASWFAVIVIVTGVQAVVAFLTRAVPVLGVVATDLAGVPAEGIGVLSALMSFGTMLFLMAGMPMLAAFGSIRLLQAGAVAGGLGLIASAGFSWPLMLVAAFVIGLGYAPSSPAGSHLLMRHAPPRRRALLFSVKQAGVPVGGVVAGLLVPAIALWWDARAALIAGGLIAIATALVIEPYRDLVDGAEPPGEKLRFGALLSGLNPLGSLRIILADRRTTIVTLTGLSLGFAQGSVQTYFVVFLMEAGGLSLAAAGSAFAIMQGVGIASRLAAGWVADAIGSAPLTLAVLGISSTCATVLLALLAPTAEPALLWALSLFGGIATASWNGVFLYELGMSAPEGRVGETTAAGTFVIFLGYVISPLVVGGLLWAGAGYAAALIVSSLPAGLSAIAILSVSGRKRGGA